jgi:hypothetical protein
MSCITPEELVDWFAGDLDDERVDRHLLTCDRCSLEAQRLAPLVNALRIHIPQSVSTAGLQALQRRGWRIAHHDVPAGEHVHAPFPDDADLLVLDLKPPVAGAARVDCVFETSAGVKLIELPDVAFEADTGRLQLACQRHYLEIYPPGEFKVTVLRSDGDAPIAVAEFYIRHT